MSLRFKKELGCSYLSDKENRTASMSSVIESYKLGDIQVEISKTDHPQKLQVDCNDGNYHSEFTIREYEYKNYKRHMNQRIKNAYKQQYEEGAE